MKKKSCYITFVLLLLANLSFSQNEFSKWYFGATAGLDFSTTPPSILSNGFTAFNTGGGCATICDNSGNLLFYSNGGSIFNSAHSTMANGSSLNGTIGSSQTVIIVKQPGNNTLYYVFTTAGASFLSYHIVDMSLAANMGSVTVKNATLDIPTCNKLIAVRHCNGEDVWIVSHGANSNQFKTFLLDKNGISNTPVISSLGPTSSTTPGTNGGIGGYMKISPDGQKLALAQYTNSVPASDGPEGFYLFDFNPSSGVLTNSLQLKQEKGAYGVEFSSDGKKLYGVMNGGIQTTTYTNLYQWDVCAGSNAAIISSEYSLQIGTNNSYLSGALQRAIDDKIYLTASVTGTASTYSISVINNPNSSGAAMNFVIDGQIVSNTVNRKPAQGLPNFINPYVKPAIGPVSSTLSCQTVNFAIPTTTYAGGCTTHTFPITGYLWDFGDATTGSANTSTLANPSHLFSALGTYTVKTIVYSNCSNDTILTTVNITSLSPVVSVAGNTLVCKGEKWNYTASGANSYVWSTSATTSTVSLAPTATTAYTVTGTTNSCKTSKVFTVTVEPCTGISKFNTNSSWHVYPNPFTTELKIESSEESVICLYDLAGKKIFEQKISAGFNSIDTENLVQGIYLLRVSNPAGQWRARYVKVER